LGSKDKDPNPYPNPKKNFVDPNPKKISSDPQTDAINGEKKPISLFMNYLEFGRVG
jgi:hypothetical protein